MLSSAISSAISSASDLCQTIVYLADFTINANDSDNTHISTGQLINLNIEDCIADALPVITLEIDNFVSWINESEGESE